MDPRKQGKPRAGTAAAPQPIPTNRLLGVACKIDKLRASRINACKTAHRSRFGKEHGFQPRSRSEPFKQLGCSGRLRRIVQPGRSGLLRRRIKPARPIQSPTRNRAPGRGIHGLPGIQDVSITRYFVRHVGRSSQAISSAVSFSRQRGNRVPFKCPVSMPDDRGRHALFATSQASATCARGTSLALAIAPPDRRQADRNPETGYRVSCRTRRFPDASWFRSGARQPPRAAGSAGITAMPWSAQSAAFRAPLPRSSRLTCFACRRIQSAAQAGGVERLGKLPRIHAGSPI